MIGGTQYDPSNLFITGAPAVSNCDKDGSACCNKWGSVPSCCKKRFFTESSGVEKGHKKYMREIIQPFEGGSFQRLLVTELLERNPALLAAFNNVRDDAAKALGTVFREIGGPTLAEAIVAYLEHCTMAILQFQTLLRCAGACDPDLGFTSKVG